MDTALQLPIVPISIGMPSYNVNSYSPSIVTSLASSKIDHQILHESYQHGARNSRNQGLATIPKSEPSHNNNIESRSPNSTQVQIKQETQPPHSTYQYPSTPVSGGLIGIAPNKDGHQENQVQVYNNTRIGYPYRLNEEEGFISKPIEQPYYTDGEYYSNYAAVKDPGITFCQSSPYTLANIGSYDYTNPQTQQVKLIKKNFCLA